MCMCTRTCCQLALLAPYLSGKIMSGNRFLMVVMAVIAMSMMAGVAEVQAHETIANEKGKDIVKSLTFDFSANEFHPDGKRVQLTLTNDNLPQWSKLVNRVCVDEYMIGFLCVQLRDILEKVKK